MAIVTLVVAASALVVLMVGRWRTESVLGAALAVLLLLGAVSPQRAVGGFASVAMLTVALLFVVAAGLRASGALSLIARPLLRDGGSFSLGLLRLCVPVALLSAVLNNTPVVALLIPEVRAWARRRGVAASRVLIPLSYAAILGGLGTLIGTSTNLVVNDLVAAAGVEAFGFLEIGLIGGPVAAVGLAVLVIGNRWLLPDRPDIDEAFGDPRTFTAEFIVRA
ncbi:MAG: SLC13 family permease, partial [Planctomycetota bacterium]|nr:SLC13 family permease [Planctomycetota bacterium]